MSDSEESKQEVAEQANVEDVQQEVEEDSDFTPVPLPDATVPASSADDSLSTAAAAASSATAAPATVADSASSLLPPPPTDSAAAAATEAAYAAPTVTHTLPSGAANIASSSTGSLLGGVPAAGARIYIGNLGRAITDQLLYSIFACMGPILECKVIMDRQGQSAGYGFVGYADRATAQKAIEAFHGRWIYDSELRVDWAKGTSGGAGVSSDASTRPPQPSSKYTLFVGDLDPAIQDDTLLQAFSQFGPCTEARVMLDQAGRSRRFGFVGYDLKEHAQLALDTMNGQFLGSKAVRINWASQRNQSTPSPAATDIDIVLRQADPSNTVCFSVYRVIALFVLELSCTLLALRAPFSLHLVVVVRAGCFAIYLRNPLSTTTTTLTIYAHHHYHHHHVHLSRVDRVCGKPGSGCE
jgi:RNA recognition motif-containing protein